MQQEQHLQAHGGHAFVIHCAAAVDVPVLNHAGEWIHCPLTPLDAHHVQVAHQQERLLFAGAFEPCDEVAAAFLLLEDYRRNAFFVQDRLQMFSRFGLVTGWTGGIHLDEPSEYPDHLVATLREVRRCGPG